MIRILGTTRDNFFSNSIRNLTGEPISHVAVELFNTFIIHSNLKGVNIQSSVSFWKENQIVIELKPIYCIEKNEIRQKINDMMEKYERASYDFGAFIYLGIYFFLRSKLKISLPKKNLWQSTGMFICSEWTSQWVNEREDSMLTPWKFIQKLKDSKKWSETL